MKETKRCITCGKKAFSWSGHVLSKRGKSIFAGFCKDHEDNKCPNAYGIIGCYGVYKKRYGKRKDTIL